MLGLKRLLSLSSRSVIVAFIAFGLTTIALAAWSGPPAGTPPNNCTTGTAGCDAPVNVGSSNQIKTGTFTTGGLAAPTITATTQFCINASCISAWPAGGTLGGSGGVNYLSKFVTASTLGNSIIYDNGTTIDIGGTNASGRKLEVYSGNGDAIVFGQDTDDSNTIQTYINGQWANRTTYANGCCNLLKINPDIGDVQIGPLTITHGGTVNGTPTFSSGPYTNDWFRVNGGGGIYWQSYGGGWFMQDGTWMRVYNDKNIYTGGTIQAGNVQFNDGSQACRSNGANCPGGAAGHGFYGMYTEYNWGGCYMVNMLINACGCPAGVALRAGSFAGPGAGSNLNLNYCST